MRPAGRLLLALLLAAHPAAALPPADGYGRHLPVRLPAPGDAEAARRAAVDCETPILAAERRYAIPTGLLLAIAVVETGRPDAHSGPRHAWPWTVNAGGQGLFFPDRTAAVAWVLAAQKAGTASIDIGCLQVNLAAHPTAFRSVADGFDPALNADFAARFLLSLFGETGDWQTAVGKYHSRTLALARAVPRPGGAAIRPVGPVGAIVRAVGGRAAGPAAATAAARLVRDPAAANAPSSPRRRHPGPSPLPIATV